MSGDHGVSDARISIVVSRFNDRVTDGLLAGALEALGRLGVSDDAIRIVRVAGAFEIPQVLGWLGASSVKPDAMIALGAIVRGETPHFDHLSRAVTSALEEVALSTGIPVSNGVLTCDTPEQALARSSGATRNRGGEAAQAALEMVGVRRRLAGS
ncbi:MAG: 6,7-dimethyl-8-ribityllumazine synthase [Acidobacteriota bacterium]|nr:6,7-dimethyl-8-ribityllumazine synthase [Acidobacteriota bacterium]